MPEYKAITKVCKIYNCVCAYLNNEFTYYSHLYTFLLFLSLLFHLFSVFPWLFWGFKANQQKLILLGSSREPNCVFLYLYF